MNWTYDESLSQNPFFQHIQQHHSDIIKRAAEDNWIICVPRLGTLDPKTITTEDVLEHIMVPTSKLPCNQFNSLDKQQEVTVEDKCLVSTNKKHTRILFEETFYVNKFIKYNLFCIEKPLSRKASTPDYSYCFLNLQECIRLLQDKHSNLVQYIHKYIENVESQLVVNNVSVLKSTISVWYKDIFKVCDSKIKLAVETYIQHCIYIKLFSMICNCTAEGDAAFNKIIRNITDIQLKDLDLNEYTEDKVSCLRRALRAFSSKSSKLLVTTDITLKIFVFLIIKSSINNWIANLTYITQFKYMIDIFDEHSFIVTTLEAAIEFIKSEKLHQSYDISNTQLFHFIKIGNLDSVKKYLQSEPFIESKKCHPLCNCHKCSEYVLFNLNSCDDKGLTALHVACFYGHANIVEFFLSQNVFLDCFDYSEMMPIHYTALKGHQNALLLLLHAGALINPKNSGGHTPLHLASNNGHENCVKALLYFAEQQESSLDINSTNNFGDTPLHLASKWGFCNIVNTLIQYGADRNIKNKRFQTVLDVAQNNLLKNLLLVDNGNKTITTHLHFSPVNSGIPHKKNKPIDLLWKAIENNDTPLMCYYLGIPMPQASFNSNLAPASTCHPLCSCESCTSKQSVNCEKSVCEKPLNVNASNADGFSALHIASLYDNTDILRILLDSGASVNIKTKKLCSPLHLACINHCSNVVRELVKCGGCDIDAQDSQGNTALHHAVLNNNTKIAEILLTNGSSCNIKNYAGKTPMQMALDKSYCNIVKLFSKNCKSDENKVSDLFT